jgi:hypothetical protein
VVMLLLAILSPSSDWQNSELKLSSSIYCSVWSWNSTTLVCSTNFTSFLELLTTLDLLDDLFENFFGPTPNIFCIDPAALSF